MHEKELELLKSVLERHGGLALLKQAQQNPMENSMFSNLIDGALKGLEVVALATFDWKLTAIVKLLQSWIKDKREEKAEKSKSEQYSSPSFGTSTIDYNYYG